MHGISRKFQKMKSSNTKQVHLPTKIKLLRNSIEDRYRNGKNPSTVDRHQETDHDQLRSSASRDKKLQIHQIHLKKKQII